MVLAAAHPWYSLTWVEWIGVFGLPLTLLGLWLTWWQAKRATDAANAAKSAVRRTQGQLRANQLLVLIPQLRWISAELDWAIAEENAALAKRYLDNWRSQAGNIRGLLDAADAPQTELLDAIQESVGLAATAGANLLSASTTPVLKRCVRARTSIVGVCDQLNVWVGKSSTHMPDGG